MCKIAATGVRLLSKNSTCLPCATPPIRLGPAPAATAYVTVCLLLCTAVVYRLRGSGLKTVSLLLDCYFEALHYLSSKVCSSSKLTPVGVLLMRHAVCCCWSCG